MLVFGNISGCSNTQASVRNFAQMVPYLDGDKLQVFELDINQYAEESVVSSYIQTYDPNKNLVATAWNTAFRSTYLKCLSYAGISGNFVLPFIAYINGDGDMYAYSTGHAQNEEMLETLVLGGIEDTYSGRTFTPQDLGVEVHTWDEIREFCNAHPINLNASPEYEATPSATSPYSVGIPTSATRIDGLNAINQIRYIAGLSHNITLDDS